MITTLYIQGSRLDQHADESVEVNSSVLDISDITKNTGDYTKTFTVPASKRNNSIFKHWYDANIDNSFDARIKVDGEIHLDGILFKMGRFRLTKVNVKKNKPDSYTINFFGNLVNLKDTLGKDELSGLDLSYFNHSYNSTNVRTGLTSENPAYYNLGGNVLAAGDIIYNLLAKKQYYIDTANPSTSDPKTRNIAFRDDSSDTGVMWNDLRPSIKIIRLIDAIENKYNAADYENPIVFSRDFFGTTEFTQLYMWLNPSENKEAGGDTKIIDWNGGDLSPTYFIDQNTNIGTYPFPAGNLQSLIITLKITPLDQTITYEVIIYVDGEEYAVNQFTGNSNFQNSIPVDNEASTVVVYWEIRTTQFFEYDAVLEQRRRHFIGGGLEGFQDYEPTAVTTATSQTIESNFIVSEEVPKIKIIDFLKGLFNMFKLVVVPQDDGTLYVDSLVSYYSKGGLYDVTKYIDFEKYDVNRGKILNEIELKYSEAQTIVAMQFEANNNRGYGDSEVTLKDDNGKLLDGESLKFTLPFEQVVYERLPDLATGDLTGYQYGGIIDESSEPVNPKLLIFYNLFEGQLGDVDLGFIQDNGLRVNIDGSINTPFHQYELDNPNFSVLFEAEYSTYTSIKLTNSLYKNHYQDYVQSIFNPKKRNFVFKAVLPLHIITKLQLNDTLEIKGNYYRIDKYSYNLLTGETTLNLINNFEKLIGASAIATPLQPTITTSSAAGIETIQVTNLSGKTVSKIDTGSGTSWVTLTQSGNNLSMDISANTTIIPRAMGIDLGNGSLTIDVSLFQSGIYLTADNNSVTADSNIITADNNGTTSN
jgi:hypothetical protein